MFSERNNPSRFENAPIIFRAHISTKSREYNYIFKDNILEIKEIAKEALSKDLPKELKNIYGIDVDIEIKHIREGSLTVYFAAILTLYSAISGYQGFYDSIALIKRQAEDLLRTRMQGEYPQLDVGVTPVYLNQNISQANENQPCTNVNTFFNNKLFLYFLLILSIVEFIAIAWLVHFAVIWTYSI